MPGSLPAPSPGGGGGSGSSNNSSSSPPPPLNPPSPTIDDQHGTGPSSKANSPPPSSATCKDGPPSHNTSSPPPAQQQEQMKETQHTHHPPTRPKRARTIFRRRRHPRCDNVHVGWSAGPDVVDVGFCVLLRQPVSSNTSIGCSCHWDDDGDVHDSAAASGDAFTLVGDYWEGSSCYRGRRGDGSDGYNPGWSGARRRPWRSTVIMNPHLREKWKWRKSCKPSKISELLARGF